MKSELQSNPMLMEVSLNKYRITKTNKLMKSTLQSKPYIIVFFLTVH
jgi:hypothetical protein